MNSNTLPSKHILNQRYTIKKAIGQGGFGITYLAFDSLLDQEVCIKELYISGYSSRKEDLTIATTSVQGFSFKELVASFVKEAKKLAKFRHPNIVRVTDVFHANGTAYMVMDYIKGETLSQIIKKGGALIDKKSTDFFYMLLDAVETIHQKKILHRDIKPGNILITKENKLVLIDFGSAREYVDDGSKTHTAMVSKGYSPNEQYTSRALRGPFTDIYSLGATLYYMLTGKIPIEAPARSTEKLPSPNELNPGVSEHLSKVVMKAMEVLPGNRFQTVSSFREALQKITLSEDTVAANQEENTQFEGSDGTTKKFPNAFLPFFFKESGYPLCICQFF
jgi:serine/threonine protein kinase